MTDSSADRDPLERLAEEFVARFRRGERPSLTEYAGRLPGRADEVRDLFPALVEMEQLKPVTADHTGSHAPAAEPTDPVRVGEFRILRRVGHGGMGVVYEAVQESLGRHVALKLMPAEALLDPKRLERFRREARAAARLHHTNIVPVFGVGEADGRHYYAMQFIAGHPLDAVIDEVKRLKDKSAATVTAAPRAVSEVAAALVTGTFAAASVERDSDDPNESRRADGSALTIASSSPGLSGSMSEAGRHYWGTVARVGAQVADALAYAHAQGILHRDIKPANLLLDLHGIVWVTDFGLAKSADADNLTYAGDVVGTLRYMAPERFDGPGDGRADVYALGLTLYELLTLKPAFAADNRAKLVEQVTAACPPSPRSVDSAIPRDLETIVLKATARDPAARYQSAADLADDLRRFTEDRPIRARRASSAEQAWRWCRRNKAVASLSAAVLLVFAVGAGISTYFALEARRRAAAESAAKWDAESNAVAADFHRQTALTLADLATKRLKEAVERQQELERQQEFTNRLLYVSQINGAQAALNDGRISRVMQLLRETTPKAGEPDLRGWEWRHLDRQIRPDREIVLADPEINVDPTTRRTSPGRIILSTNGERACIRHTSEDREYFEVKETATGRLVGRVPPSGFLPVARRDNGTRPSPGVISLTRRLFSPDGRHLLLFVSTRRSNAQEPAPLDPAATRLWNVDTGVGVALPEKVMELAGNNYAAVLGRDAGSLTWIRVSERRPGPEDRPGGIGTNGPVEVVCYRWDRATDALTESDPFLIGRYSGRPILTSDGSAVNWFGQQRPARDRGFGGPGKEPPTPESDAAEKGPWLECWDVTTARPAKRFGKHLPTTDAQFSSAMSRSLIEYSPDGTKAAYRSGPDEVTVYRMTDGQEHARIPLTGVSAVRAAGPGVSRLQAVAVGDDGNRIVVRRPNMFYVVEKTDRGSTTRRYLIPEVLDQDSLPTTLLSSQMGFLADGRTFLDISDGHSVKLWDVTRDPNALVPVPGPVSSIVERDGRKVSRVTTSDGRFTLERPADPLDEVIGPSTTVGPRGERLRLFAGPVVVCDAAGKSIGRLPDPPTYSYLTAEALGDGRRLLVNFTLSGDGPSGFARSQVTQVWRLYDLGGGVRQIDGGPGRLARVAGTPYLISTHPGMADVSVSTQIDQPYLELRHGETGELVRSIRMPKRDVRFCGFDPTGRHYLVQSAEQWNQIRLPRPVLSAAELAVVGGAFTVNPRFVRPGTRPTGPEVQREFESSMVYLPGSVRVHLFETATGKELWARDVTPERVIEQLSPAVFTPDGKWIVMRYQTRTGPARGSAATGNWTTNPTGSEPIIPARDRIWVAGVDGTVERVFAVHENPAVVARRPCGPGRTPTTEFACSPDGRHVAVPWVGEVQVWDLLTGTLKHRLGGHAGVSPGIAVAYNADGTRLATRDAPESGFVGVTDQSTTTGRALHVWDMATGRELLTLTTGRSSGFPAGALEFRGEKLFVRQLAGHHVFDGTPVTP